MNKNLEKIISWGTSLLVFLLPLFFLPITTEFYGWNKNFLLILGVLGVLGLWAGKMVLAKQVRLVKTPLDLPVLLVAVAFLVSTLVVSPNKVESFLVPGGTGTILALTLLYFLVTNNLIVRLGGKGEAAGLGEVRRLSENTPNLTSSPNKLPHLNPLTASLTASAVVLALVAIYQFAGVGEALAPVEWMKAKTWTPAGGLIPLASFLGVIGVMGVIREANLTSQESRFRQLADHLRGGQLLRAAATVVILVGLGITVYQLAVTNKPILLPYSTGWAVGLEAFKNHPLLGVGPGQFLTAFTRFRPLIFNQTDQWYLRFGASSNWYFHLLTEVGVVGLGAFLWVAYKVVTQLAGARKSGGLGTVKVQQAGLLPLIGIFLLLALLPANFLLLLAFYVLLAQYTVGLAETHRVKISLVALREGLVAVEKTELGKYYGGEEIGGKIREDKQSLLLADARNKGKIEILPWLVFIPTVIIILGSFYFLGRVYAAEMDYRKALDAALANRGKETYDLQISAITKNPYLDYYRTSYSQTNLALANNLASQPDLTDQDRAIVTQLVQQAIREGKAAVALNQIKVQNWENLASLYRALINFATGADQWTVAAYTQAINLDPFNPGLRIDLGGVWYALGDFERAQRQFELAVNLKPDLANAHYNLATALRENDKLDLAQQELEATLSLLEVGSNDYQRVRDELEGLKEGLEGEEGREGEELETLAPPETPSEGIEPPLELGEEAGPEITPQPTPTEEVNPTPTPRQLR